jgi:CheY-like chemotaxis protein
MGHILVVQWHSEIRSLMILLLRQRGYTVTAVQDLSAAATHEGEGFSLLCLDMMTPGVDPADPLQAVRDGEIGEAFSEIQVLLTDVNGLLTSSYPEGASGADGVFAPRSGRGFPFLVEVERLAPPPTQLPGPVHTWRLDKDELPAFLYACYLFGVHGVLTLRDGRIFKRLHFSDGWIRSASSSLESDWLGKMLLARHQITPTALNEVERALAESGNLIGQEFIQRGYLNDTELVEALNQQYASIVMSVFEWEWAEVSLDEGSPNAKPHLGLHPFQLIVAGLSYGFTEEEVDELLGGVNSYPTPTVWTAFRVMDLDLSDNERYLLRLIDGQRSVRQIIETSRFSSEATKKFLYALQTIRATVMSLQPRNVPLTIDGGVDGSRHVAIETGFFEDDPTMIELDDTEPDFFDDLTETKLRWWEQLTILDLQQTVRYLLLVILALLTLWVGIQILVERDFDERQAARDEVRQDQRSEIVRIDRPKYAKADTLVMLALIHLRDTGWDGIDEARSLIGGALAIDQKFQEARNLAQSIALAEDAKFAIEGKNWDAAAMLISEAQKQFPENPLLVELLVMAGPHLGDAGASP